MKIPKRAKRVFAGIVYDVYHWKEKNFDGTPATFEAVKRQDSVQVIPLMDGKVCVGREVQPGTKPFYSFIGGRAEEGETPLAAAKREMLEETGLASDNWELLFVWDAPGRIEWRIYYYVARDCKKVADPTLDAGERISLKRVEWDRFVKLLARDDFRGGSVLLQHIGMSVDAKRLAAFRKTVLRP